MYDITLAANRRFLAQVQRQQQASVIKRVEQEARMREVRAVQWRSRLTAVERKLREVRALLRELPQDAELRRECETLEATYKALLEEAG
jgi:hypothetical protein